MPLGAYHVADTTHRTVLHVSKKVMNGLRTSLCTQQINKNKAVIKINIVNIISENFSGEESIARIQRGPERRLDAESVMQKGSI